MNILVLLPTLNSLKYSYILKNGEVKSVSFRTDQYRALQNDKGKLLKVLDDIINKCKLKSNGKELDAIAIKVKYGDEIFNKPVIVDDAVMTKLNGLISSAPLHIPALIKLIESCRMKFANIPVVLSFETAFFVNLPDREKFYGIDFNLSKNLGIRRFGFCGLYHEAACKYIIRKTRAKNIKSVPRIISICLEPKPEVAGVIGINPQTVTSGAALLEGIPGQSSCGELDPTIVLTLSQKFGWGPEQINTVLTKESGLSGLMGKQTDFNEVFDGADTESKAAQKFMEYRFILACGAAAAAIGGVDAVVFSGRYNEIGKKLLPAIKNHLTFSKIQRDKLMFEFLDESIEEIIADQTAAAVLAEYKAKDKLQDIAGK